MQVETVCPACGALLGQNERFCPFCGAAAARLCPWCGNLESADSAFCGECGAPLGEEKPVRKERRKPDYKKAIRFAAAVLALCLLAGAAGLIGGGTAHAGRFLRGLACYCTGDPVRTVMWLEPVDSRWADHLKGSCAEMAYKKGVRAYREGDHPSAVSFFSVTGDLGDSELYRLMLNAHKYNYYYNETSVAKIISTVMENWDFEDAPSALVSNQYVAETWLRGRWEDKEGYRYFAMDDDAMITFNLPRGDGGTHYKVKLGIIYMYNDREDEESWVPAFELYPMSGDSISVYCYIDNKYYNLYKTDKGNIGGTQF